MKTRPEVFDPELLTGLGLDYQRRTVRTPNETGYMRNFLCEFNHPFANLDRVIPVIGSYGQDR